MEESAVNGGCDRERDAFRQVKFGGERGCVCVRREGWDEEEEGVKIQLLSSSSVAVSTSQDFDDNATITAF